MLGFISVGGIIAIIIGALIVVVLPLWLISVYNTFIKFRNDVDEAFSTMDVYLKKRYDLIPNFVETVKGYAKHEKETLEKVMQARYSAMNASTTEQKIDSENILQGALKSLFAVAENYPDLKANQNFIELQNTLKELEADIANSRKYYNGVVKLYNTKRETFPSNIIAGIFKFTKKPLFEVETAEERKNVKVSF